MGLSSKQAYPGDGFSWAKNLMQAGALQLPSVGPVRQQQQQQQQQQSGTPLKCPRCESTNTKFCYYNNYNRSQPRHLCKSCRRHWTKGGTLRNVPVGGGRKNKRLKTTDNTTNTTIQPHHQHLPLEFNDEKKFSDIFYQSLFQPTSSLLPSSQSQSNFTLSSDSALPFINNPSSLSSSLQMPSVLNYTGEALTCNDLTTTNTMATTMTSPMPVQWQVPTTNSAIDSVSYWNWEDLHTFSQTDHAKQPWDHESLENK